MILNLDNDEEMIQVELLDCNRFYLRLLFDNEKVFRDISNVTFFSITIFLGIATSQQRIDGTALPEGSPR